jgi:hypothetical protein
LEAHKFPGEASYAFWIYLGRAYAKKAYVWDLLHNFPKSQYVNVLNYFCVDALATRSTASFLHLLLSCHLSRRGFEHLAGLVKDLFEHCATCTATISDDLDGSPTISCSDFLIGRDLNHHCGARYGTPLVAASSLGNEDVIKQLLDAGADVNVCSEGRGPSSNPETDLWSLLEAAVSAKYHEQSIELLLNRGASINMRCRKHGSALGAAAFARQTKAVQLLLNRGADVNLEDSDGCNIALKEAVSAPRNNKTVETLVCAVARVKAGSMDHVTFKTPYDFSRVPAG